MRADRAIGLLASIVESSDARLPHEMELVVFRLVQECLTNIPRHSGSKTAQIRVAREGNSVYVEVQDQSKGISQGQLAEIQDRGTGVGIRGMRERVRLFHGELTIESNASGTRISASLPIKPFPAGEASNGQKLGAA